MTENKTLIHMEFGSTVYGTSVPTSDKDYKGVFLPCSRDILLGTGRDAINVSTKPEGQLKNGASDIDSEMFALKKYMHLLLQGQTVALSMVFMPRLHILSSSEEWELIVCNRSRFLHKGVSAFAGYCRQQANKYGIKGSRVAAARLAMNVFQALQDKYGAKARLRDHWKTIELALGRDLEEFPEDNHIEFILEDMRGNAKEPTRMLSVCNRKVQENITVDQALKIYTHLFDEYGERARQAENNENVDWKACLHAVRVAAEAKELLLHHTITYPRPEAPLLLQIRKGELPYPKVAELIEQGLADLEAAQLVSTLPEEPDRAFAEELVLAAYRTRVAQNA